MTDRIGDQGDQQDDERRPGGGKPAQPPALREDEERCCKERCEQPRARVCVRQEREGSTSGDATHDAPAVRAPRIFQHEQQDDEDERLQGHLDGNPTQLEQPGREPAQRNDRGRDADVTRSTEGQKSEQQNGRKDANRSKASRDLRARACQPEHARRARTRTRGSCSRRTTRCTAAEATVLVSQRRRDRRGVVGDGSLVAMEARWIRRIDPQME